jgi:hypothetical protein
MWERFESLKVVRLRVEFLLEGSLMVHSMNGPMVRGAFGTALRSIYGKRGLYELLFSGDHSAVRGYRIECGLGEPAVLGRGGLLSFDLWLFGSLTSYVSELLPVFVVMGHLGFGEGRCRARLHSVSVVNGGSLRTLVARSLSESSQVKVSSFGREMPRIGEGIRFVTPVRLASRGPVGVPHLEGIVESTMQRLHALACISEGGGSLVEGFRPIPGDELGAIVREWIRPYGWEWRNHFMVREQRLSRNEGLQPVTGALGELVLMDGIEKGSLGKGSLGKGSDLTRALSLACLVGVGRHTSMGLGCCVPLDRYGLAFSKS